MTCESAMKKDHCFEQREFPMSALDYHRIQVVAFNKTGITLSNQKKHMIYSRLARRIRHLKLNNFHQYCELIERDNSCEENDFINAITTNLTAFFRENHHFEFLKNQLIPQLISRNKATKRLRIWAAGCSTGEEPYSIALILNDLNELSSWDVKILATDLDTNVLNTAKNGHYPIDRLATIPKPYHHFLRFNRKKTRFKFNAQIQKYITFKQLNLLDNWPMQGPFDVIFCRNVVIYFDAKTQQKLFFRYAELCHEQSHLFIGHSENLHHLNGTFISLGRTIYAKC